MIFGWLTYFTAKLDDFLRFRDLRTHRTVGGPLDRTLGIRRHTRPALTLPTLLCALLVLASPSWTRIGLAAIAGLVVLIAITIGMRYTDRKNWAIAADLLVQVVAVVFTAAVVWWLGPDTYSESGVYRHLFVPIDVALSVSLLLASVVAVDMFRPLQAGSEYNQYLVDTELFADRGPAPQVMWGTMFTAILMALFRAPLALLTLPAIVALLSRPLWLKPLTAIMFGVCFLALFFAGLNERFGIMWRQMQAVFFKGGALLVSLLVIVLAAGRLAGITYVTTVFDTAAWWNIGVILAGFYTLSWWYDYWANRLLTDQIIGLIKPGAFGTAAIPYEIDPARVETDVPAEGRQLQIHGSSRFIAIASGPGHITYFQPYTMSDLIDILAVSGAPGGHAYPTPVQIRGRISNFHTVAVLLFVLLVGFLGWRIYDGERTPEAVLTQSAAASGLPLGPLLFRTDLRTKDRPVIVLAASGGGTRAALYTAAVLEGIAARGALSDVVLASGVSGGGAALAYFASWRDKLLTPGPNEWDKYFETMSEPYIQDVLQRSSEWRMVAAGRLGQLLDESFREHWRLRDKHKLLEDVSEMGLIFNTSLAGNFDRPRDAPAGKLVDIEPPYRARYTKSSLAGGRLLLTNLHLPADLTGQPLEPEVSHRLPVIVRSHELRLETAAALNANFPPVFSNTAIDVDDRYRYWVTDGGAVDNRGMEMLLYSLRLALDKHDPDTLPRLHVVVADASGLSDDYTQDRGVSSALGAGTHFASHLDSELVGAIRKLYEKHPDRFQFSYVMMPDRLRASGSFGTHWMLQPSIEVHHGVDKVTIGGPEMIQVLRALHTPGKEKGLSSNGCRVLAWGREDHAHQDNWLKVVQALGGADVSPVCPVQ